jgi:hypothetical protein
MTKLHGGSPVKKQGVLNRGTHTRPSTIHHGSGKPLGVVTAAPTRPRANPSGGMHGGSGRAQGVLNKKRT